VRGQDCYLGNLPVGKLHPLDALAQRVRRNGPYFNGKFQGGVGLSFGNALQGR
jgi:hypothetical protein